MLYIAGTSCTLTPNWNVSIFGPYLTIINTFFEKYCGYLEANCLRKVKNCIKTLIGHVVFKLLIKAWKIVFLIKLLKKILMPFFSFSENLLQDTYKVLIKLDNLEITQKISSILFRGALP